MKKLFFCCALFAATSFGAFAQAVTVANTAANIVYIGIDNPIQITAQGYAPADLTVTVSNGTIAPSASQPGIFLWKVGATGIVKLSIAVKGKFLYDSDFHVKRLNMPVAQLNNSKEMPHLISADDLLLQTGITAKTNNTNTNECSVASFELTLVPPTGKGDPMTMLNTGASFNAQSLNLIGRAESGAVYYFDNVQAQCGNDKDTMKINSMVFKVK